MDIASSLLLLQPGVFILRHPKNNPAPLSISRAAANPLALGKLQVAGTPGTDNCVLRHGADCLVLIITDGPVELLVSAYLPVAGAPVPALRVDQIGLDKPAAAAAPAVPVTAPPPADGRFVVPARGISLIGHVERQGDLLAPVGAPLGDPARQFRLEGFQVMWPDKPDGVDLAYSVSIEGAGAQPMVKTGQFAGARRQARRITEVTFALIGPNAHGYTLQGTAWFSGGFQAPVQSGLPLGGPSGLEHLTALQLAVAAAAPAQAAANPWDASPRTKVFKSDAAAPAVAAPTRRAAAQPGKTVAEQARTATVPAKPGKAAVPAPAASRKVAAQPASSARTPKPLTATAAKAVKAVKAVSAGKKAAPAVKAVVPAKAARAAKK